MNKEELKSKRAAIRREIKGRMQAELDARRGEIKHRLKSQDLSVQEKREKYRTEVHREKLRLMKAAKEEFRARKKMLGEAVEEEAYDEEFDEFEEREYVAPAAEDHEVVPPWHVEEEMPVQDDDDFRAPADKVSPHEAFILESTTDEREALSRFESPIDEYDALPPGGGPFDDSRPAGGPPQFASGIDSDVVQAPNLFYYAWNLIFHPIQTLDEFDEYIAFPSGLRNVAIFYLVSILPIVVAAYLSQSFGEKIGGGMSSAIAPQQSNVVVIYVMSVINLLLYSLSIAVVNYLFTSEANFVTLTTYFAFVEGVTSIVIYALVIGGVFAGVVFSPALLFIGLLFLGFVVWRIALTVIVLMSAYGHGIFVSFLLAIGGLVARIVGTIFVGGLIQELVG